MLDATPREPNQLFVLEGLLLLALLLFVGLLSARAFFREPGAGADDADHEIKTLLVALGWSTGIIPTAALALHLFAGLPVSRTLLLLCALLNGAISGAALLRRRPGDSPLKVLLGLRATRAGLRRLLPVLLGAAVVGAVFALKYDPTYFHGACINRSVAIAAGWDYHGAELLRSNEGDVRIGNTGVLAAFAVLFFGYSERALAAVCGALFALGGYVLGAGVGKGPAWGWGAMALLALNPCVASIPGVDSNVLALAFSTPLLAYLHTDRARWGVAGAFFGLVVLIRHIMLPALPALVLLAWLRTRRPRAVGAFFAVFFAVTLPMHVRHVLALGCLLCFESNTQFPSMSYDLLGFELRWQGLLNWPLHDHVVRTPHNPFPMLVAWPLHLAANLGLVAFSAMALGFVTTWRASAARASFWLLWSAPVLAGLMIQEAWDYPNKMGALIVVFGAFAAWTVEGVSFVLRRPYLGVSALAVAVVLSQLGVEAVRDWSVPQDARYYSIEYVRPPRGYAEEEPRQVEHAARRATQVGLLPDAGRWTPYGPLFHRANLSDLLCSEDKRWDSGAGPMAWGLCGLPELGPPVTVEIDLSKPPYGDTAKVRLSAEPPDVDLSGLTDPDPDDNGSPVAFVHGIKTPWGTRPVTVWGMVADVSVLYVSFQQDPRWELATGGGRGQGDQQSRDDETRCYALVTLGNVGGRCTPAIVKELTSPVLRLRLPSGGLTLGVEVNIVADHLQIRKGIVSERGVELSKPFVWWHN